MTQLGAQMFTVREYTKNTKDLLETFAKLKEIGYDSYVTIEREIKGGASDGEIIAAKEYLEPIINELGIKYLMASNVDKYTGKYDGINCHGKEKVRRFYEVWPDGVIDDFYSDSLSDSPLAEISKKAYMVKGHDLFPWPEK